MVNCLRWGMNRMDRLPRLRVPKLRALPREMPEESLLDRRLRDLSRFMHSAQDHAVLSRLLPRSRAIATPVKNAIVQNLVSAYETLGKAQATTVSHTTILMNAILASDISHSLEGWVKGLAESVPTVYDEAMDKVYNAEHIGGGQLHRLFDGSHTLWGALDKTHEALPDDSVLQETMGYFSALWRDLGTHVGLPVVTWDKTNYDQAANFLTETIHIPKSWLQDMLHFNGVELFGASIGIVAIALYWKRKDKRQFSAICGSLGISALCSANPALGVLAVAGLAKSFMDARHGEGNYADCVAGLTRGGVGTGLFLGTSAVIGGPAWVGLLAGLCVGITARQAFNKVPLSQVSEFIASFIASSIAVCIARPAVTDENLP